jgi:hypothetical protein
MRGAVALIAVTRLAGSKPRDPLGTAQAGSGANSVFLAAARARAVELGVDDQVRFVHGDASGYVASESAGIAACIGATWIGGGVPGTVELLQHSLRPGGVMLIGEP